MPSFDVVSEIDTHELTNAVDQAIRELSQRFDFKDSDATFELEETTVTMSAPADFQLKQMLEILKLRMAKRGIDIACLDVKDPVVNLATAKQLVVLKGGDRPGNRQEGIAPIEGLETQGSGATPRREGACDGQEARRSAGSDRVSAQGRIRRAAAVQ